MNYPVFLKKKTTIDDVRHDLLLKHENNKRELFQKNTI